MTALIRALSAAGEQISTETVLDGEAIALSMSAAPGIASVTLRNTSPSAIDGTVRISNVSEFLSAAEGGQKSGFIVFEQGSGGGRCEININRENGPQLLSLLSPEISDYLEALMAPIATGEEMSHADYLSLIGVVYSRAISDEITASRIHASIEFPGTVTAAKGGAFSGRRAEFNIPLLDLLVLEVPIAYEVRWK
jgi:hypothetical protein